MIQLFTGSGDPAMDVLAFPGSDISGVNSSPPLVDCGYHPQLGGRIYLAAHHVIDAIHVLAPVLTTAQRDAIAANVGAVPRAELDELQERCLELAAQLATVAAENEKLADVIQLKKPTVAKPRAKTVA